MEPPQQPPGLAIQARPDVAEGVYANFAAVTDTPYEITIDFSHVNFGSNSGMLVSRVAMSPMFAQQLLTALTQTLERYAQRAIEQEVGNDGTDQPGTGPSDDRPA